MIREVRKAVLSVTPFNSVVIVVSGGENEYLQIEGRTAWHFPQQADGRHSGLLPDSASRAINALEALRTRGAHYVVFPASAFWWLSLFSNLEEHLERTGRRIWGDEQCIIYELADPAAATTPEASTPDQKKWGKLFKRNPPRA